MNALAGPRERAERTLLVLCLIHAAQLPPAERAHAPGRGPEPPERAPRAAQETEKRLRDTVAGKRQAGPLVANGGARKGPAGKQRQAMLVFTVRLTGARPAAAPGLQGPSMPQAALVGLAPN